jgi:phosphoglycerate dehydrogenase-like enzyme
MHILIPNDLTLEETVAIKKISPSIELSTLKVTKKELIVNKVLRKLSSILLPYKIYKRIFQFFNTRVKFVFFVNSKLLNSPLHNIDVFLATWTISNEMFTGLMNYLPDLRWVHSTKAGVDHLTDKRLSEKNIIVTCSRGIHSNRMAEFALSLILSFAKRIPEHIELTGKRVWRELESKELGSMTVGIIGIGNIGKEIAKKAKNFGLKVVGYDFVPVNDENFQCIYGPGRLFDLLQISDFLVICLPLTKKTKHLIKDNELAQMKKGAFLINIARGEIVSEESLFTALKEKRLSAAAIDVVEGDYLPCNHPFYKLNNIIITHHSAFSSEKARTENLHRFYTNVDAFLNQADMLGEVNKIEGF